MGEERRGGRRPFVFWCFLLSIWSAINAVALGQDLFNLYVALELLTFAAVPLVCIDGRPETLAAALDYWGSLPALQLVRDAVLAELSPSAGDVICDIGCGTGSELVRVAHMVGEDGVIRGELAAKSDRIVQDGRTFSYELYPATPTTPALKVMQNDVRAIQLGKAALYAGVRLLMERLNITTVERIRLAGAFGRAAGDDLRRDQGPHPGDRPVGAAPQGSMVVLLAHRDLDRRRDLGPVGSLVREDVQLGVLRRGIEINDAGTIGLSLNGKSFPATEPVRIWHLLTHTAGIRGADAALRAREWCTRAGMCAAAERDVRLRVRPIDVEVRRVWRLTPAVAASGGMTAV